MNSHYIFRWRMLALLLLATNAGIAHANLGVYPMRVSAEPGGHAEVRVTSQSPKPQYVQVVIKQVLDAGTPEEREIDVVGGARAALMPSPAKFALPGGGSRLVRLIPLQDLAEEGVFRAYVESVDGGSAESADAVDLGQGASAGLNVNLIWGVLVHLLPKNGLMDVRLEGNALRNTGNVRVGIAGIAECDGKDCLEYPWKGALYPGRQAVLPFERTPGRSVQLRYRLSQDPYQENTRTFVP
ncbi:TPA: pilus assembly protein [Stenotrophomonas maltophilia]